MCSMHACTHVCMYATNIYLSQKHTNICQAANEHTRCVHAYIHRYIHTGVQSGDDSTSALTPRARAWVGAMSLPQDQSTHIALALADNLYTSVDIIVEEHPDTLLALPGFELVKAGAKVLLRKKLAELKVTHARIRVYSDMLECECIKTCSIRCLHPSTWWYPHI